MATAGRIISQSGLDSLSMRYLAAEMGIPAPTLYGYFRSKEAVIDAVAEQKIAILSAHVLGATEGADPGVPRLLAGARGYRQFALANPDYYQMFIQRSATSSEDEQEAQLSAGLELIRTLSVDVNEAIRLEQIRRLDPEESLFGLWATAHGFIMLEMGDVFAHLTISEEQREQLYLRYVEAVLLGLEIMTPSEENGESRG